MKTTYFITATNTDVGKTYAAEKFLLKFANSGHSVGYYKPIETGVINYPADGSYLLELVQILNPSFDPLLKDVVPYQFKLPASPYVAKGDTKIDIEVLKEKKEYLHTMCDILIIEGAGGLMVPVEKNLFMIDLIEIFNAKTILVTPSNLGCINDTLLSINALKDRELAFEWFINLYKDKEDFHKVTLPFYKDYFKKIKMLDEF